MNDDDNARTVHSGNDDEEARVTLEARPERRLIPRGPSVRHVDYLVRIAERPAAERPSRDPLTLALVIDRSGSMSGAKIATAKHAALAVIERLDERDTVAVVVFDEEITTVQPAARVTPSVKRQIKSALAEIGARGSTALHEGWLMGCKVIASDEETEASRGLARCFLLTDGLANVGKTDPEQIASDAAGIRRNAGIGTSTFGVGIDYAEELLGPMAEAGGGRFHHLRNASEIASTFIGELGELLATVAANARLELEVEPGAAVEVVSMYEANVNPDAPTRWSIAIGDLVSGEDRHIVVRLRFGESSRREEQAVRARLVWIAQGVERSTPWETLRFTSASEAECEAEPADEQVVHLAGEALSDRSQRDALIRSKRGDLEGARSLLIETRLTLSLFAHDDPTLQTEINDVDRLTADLADAPLSSAFSKEAYFMRQARSKGQRDLRE